MSTALTQRDGRIAFSPDQIDLIKRQFARGATDDELALFLHQCRRTGLDPLAKQIYFRKQRSKNGDVATIITGIDGYRLIADRTGHYAGNDDPIFDDEENPRRATVTVYKLVGGVRCPYTATARWDQYYPGDAQGFMWRKMPHLMLGKCAEALALRKAFPAELSGLYVKEEMDQAGETVYEPPQAPAKRPEPFKVAQKPADLPPDALSDAFPPPPEAPPARKASVYNGSPEQQRIVRGILEKRAVPPAYWEEINDALLGRLSTDIDAVIEEVRNRAN